MEAVFKEAGNLNLETFSEVGDKNVHSSIVDLPAHLPPTRTLHWPPYCLFEECGQCDMNSRACVFGFLDWVISHMSIAPKCSHINH